jgi:membrane associated rhomboid family serine protease
LASAGQAIFGRECPLTRAFIALSALVYAALAIGGGGLSLLGSVVPSQALRWGALAGELGSAEPWRYLSAMFVHFGVLHVGLNCLALYSLGRALEHSEGWAHLTLIFLGAGIGGFVVSDLWPGPGPLTGGISGGVFGLLGAGAGRRYAEGDPEWKRLAVSGLGYAVALALMMPGVVNNAAHLGGLLSGAGASWALVRFGRHPRTLPITRGLAALLLIGTLASIGLSHASDVWRAQRANERSWSFGPSAPDGERAGAAFQSAAVPEKGPWTGALSRLSMARLPTQVPDTLAGRASSSISARAAPVSSQGTSDKFEPSTRDHSSVIAPSQRSRVHASSQPA